MFSTWNSADNHDASAATASASPAAKRHANLEVQHGRRSSKATRACDLCKAKKARCNGVKPCAKCAERGLRCTYESRYSRGRPPTPLSPISDMPGGEDGSLQNPIPSTSVTSDEQRAAMASHPPPASDGPQSGEGASRQGLFQTADSSRNSPDPTAALGNAQYVDHTSALSFLHRAYSKSKTGERSSQPLTAAGDKPLLCPSTAGLSINPTILPPIPDAVESKDLLDLYFEVCVATYKPLHRGTVDAWYRVVICNIEHGLPLTDSLGNARVAALLGVLAISTFHRQKSRGHSEDIPSLSQSDAFFKVAANLIETETGEPQLESAQARLLQVFYLLMTCRMNQAWYIFGSLLQIISALGMHRRSRKEKLYPNSRSNYIHSQCRMRTFWSAYILDRYIGVVMGRPRHFHDKDIDQSHPDRVEDANMSPTGRVQNESDDSEECHIDGFIWNIKLAQFVGEVSDDLYAIRPLTETQSIAAARSLAKKLDNWHASLPALLKANPKHLIRGFRRQSVALRLAHKHAVMHLYRPFLLNRSSSREVPHDDDTQLFRRESIKICIGAAQDALRAVDNLAQEGPLFHAFWWTHYMTFCALSVTYVWNMQHDKHLEGIDHEALLALAGRCKTHLAQATATNSPSRRYSLILEELGGISATSSMPDGRHPRTETQLAVTSEVNASAFDVTGLEATHAFDSGAFGQGQGMSAQFQDPFFNWQAADWLDLDASVSGGRTADTSRFHTDLFRRMA